MLDPQATKVFFCGATSESNPISILQDYDNTNRLSYLNSRRHRFPIRYKIPVLTLSPKSHGTKIDHNIRNTALDKTLATSSLCNVSEFSN